MTKSLTEQWREGTLEFGFYYVSFPNEEPQIYSSEYLKNYVNVKDSDNIEVLALVPSYDEYMELVRNSDEAVTNCHQLEKKLEIALEVLGIIAMHSKDPVDAVQAACAISQIKEMEGVK